MSLIIQNALSNAQSFPNIRRPDSTSIISSLEVTPYCAELFCLLLAMSMSAAAIARVEKAIVDGSLYGKVDRAEYGTKEARDYIASLSMEAKWGKCDSVDVRFPGVSGILLDDIFEGLYVVDRDYHAYYLDKVVMGDQLFWRSFANPRHQVPPNLC